MKYKKNSFLALTLTMIFFLSSDIFAGDLLDAIRKDISPAKLRKLIYLNLDEPEELQNAFRLSVEYNMLKHAEVFITCNVVNINQLDLHGTTALFDALAINKDSYSNEALPMINMLASQPGLRTDIPRKYDIELLIADQDGGYSAENNVIYEILKNKLELSQRARFNKKGKKRFRIFVFDKDDQAYNDVTSLMLMKAEPRSFTQDLWDIFCGCLRDKSNDIEIDPYIPLLQFTY